MSDVTKLLSAIEGGDPQAAEDLLPLVYDELRKLAAVRLRQEPSGQTLQPTALVHEAYVRLVGGSNGLQWSGRAHFFGAASEAMRRILVDNARRKKRLRHGGEHKRKPLQDDDAVDESAEDDRLLALDAALARLFEVEPQMGELVRLRYFGGLTVEQVATALKVSPRTAKRHWAYAKAWLRREMDRDDE